MHTDPSGTNPGKLPDDKILRVFQSKKETRAFYDKISRVYDLLAEHSEAPVRQAGIEMLDIKPGESVLEIGFGTGHCLVSASRLAGPQGRVLGVDLSAQMAAVAREKLSHAGVKYPVYMVCGDAANLPIASETFDAIFMSFTLELFDNPEIPKVLAECWRTLKREGRLAVAGMSKEGPHGIVIGAFEWTHRHFPNFCDCRPIFVRRAIEEAGFDIERATLTEMWIPVEIVLGRKTIA